MSHCVLDFETFSGADLKQVGAWRYAEDPTTNVICLCFEWPNAGDTLILTWRPETGHDKELRALVTNPEVIFSAHNAGFEKAIWRRIMVPLFGFPDIPNERWHDTLAVCAMKGLPLELDVACGALGLEGKDREGSKLVKDYSKFAPRNWARAGSYLVEHNEENRQRIYSYCRQDVRAERNLANRVRDFQPGERAVWLLDQTINERGVLLDLEYIDAAQQIVRDASAAMAIEFADITGGLAATQVGKLRDWCGGEGVILPDLRKETIVGVIGHDIDSEEDSTVIDGGGDGEGPSDEAEVPEHVRRALEIRHLLGSASVKKLSRMRDCVGTDGRARGLLQYHGAGPGRWAGRIIQPHNFPRPTLRINDRPVPSALIIAAIQTGDYKYVQQVLGSNPLEVVVSGLRHALVAAAGKLYLSGDYATIEARILLAIAGQTDAIETWRAADRGEKRLDGSKIDVYCDAAAKIYGCPVDKERDPEKRDTGKHSVLGCGYGLGARTFQIKYARDRSLEFCQSAVNSYRYDWAPCVPLFWDGLEGAACRAVYDGGPHQSYGIEFRMEGQWLTMRLLSGRKVYFFNATQSLQTMPWSTQEEPDIRPGWRYQTIKNGHLVWVHAFGGLLTGICIQAIARDLLVYTMFLQEKNGFPLVLTVHDEELAEVEAARADEAAFRQIMMEMPPWLAPIKVPINVETWSGDRYRK